MQQQLQPDAGSALTTPGSLKIGIHLRLGDAEMEGVSAAIQRSTCRNSHLE